jgi:magnesium-transporting ATPase (P-type)
LIWILALAALASLLIGDLKDSIFIGAVLLLNAAIGGYQEWSADRSTGALQSLVKIRTLVLRDGDPRELDAEALVQGDVVLLESGNRVPADIRLVSSKGLLVNESFLTGESLAVAKDATFVVHGASTALGDRRDLGFAGSTISRGRARGIVLNTGMRTVVGRLADKLAEGKTGAPPLITRMERFSKAVGAFVLLAAVSVGAMGVVLQGASVKEMSFLVIALAVSAIPEGLPVAMTVALAVATRRMAARGVIVRQLAAVEGLGSCTLIASDKTGTLTCNELMVKEIRLPGGRTLEVGGVGYEPVGEITEEGRSVAPDDRELRSLLRAAVLCNEARLKRREQAVSVQGDATDIALLSLAAKAGIERDSELAVMPVWKEVPFEPELRYAASFHVVAEKTMVYVKGAPEKILEFCAGDVDFSVVEEMARSGLRTLALAGGEVEGEEIKNLTFYGFVGMIDPLRQGVKESVQACFGAGLQVSMITGDHPLTALAIGKELGLAHSLEEVITGNQLAEVPEEQLSEVTQRCRIFARIDPEQKLALVKAAQKSGHLVAVTGDGVNDAAALQAANIGVAMGRSGTDVARDASALVLADDNFSTIVAGIEEGRVAYSNVRKVIYLLVSTGAAELLMIALSVAAGLPLPLLPVQLLWLNLVTNGIQDVALAFEPQEGEPLNQPPRSPEERVFNRMMVERTAIGGLVIGLATFFVYRYLLASGVPLEDARNQILFLMVLFEIVHIGNCRSETVSAFVLSPLRNPVLLVGSLSAFALHLLAINTYLGQSILRAAPVSMVDVVWLGSISLSVLLAMECHKIMARRRIT